MNNMRNYKIAIRTDVNEVLATGQFMRCALVADILKNEYNIDSIFLSSDEETVSFAAERGYECRVLNSDWRAPGSETGDVAALLHEMDIAAIIIDSYYVGSEYIETIKQNGIITVVFDDMASITYPADIVINYGPGADAANYNIRYSKYGTHLMLGAEYIPLRKQFMDAFQEKQGDDSVWNIFLTTGGGDSLGIASAVADRILRSDSFSNHTIHLLAGRLYKPDKVMSDWTLNVNARGKRSVVIHQNVTNVSQIMSMCRMAVTPGSTTLFELCACGVMPVSFVFADNQEPDAVFFDKKGLIEYAGDYRRSPEECLNHILKGLERISTSNSGEKRHQLRNMVDGRGAWRIAAAIYSLIAD